MKQAEASDQWAFYQAKSIKGHLDDAAAALSNSPEIKARFFLADKAKRGKKEKAEVQAEAQKAAGRIPQTGRRIRSKA
ncbi:DUF4337 family protein [Undibacterium arcticum]